jgi:4-amino-4-deoxy-L-arabinose transferase-like glycosyltransferase
MGALRDEQALRPHEAVGTTPRSRLRLRWRHTGLAAIGVLAAVLNIAGLQTEGYANTYYAAAVKSMLQSWHNFFFVSFDPGGFVAIDKPPLGLWLQTASAKLFGYSGVSMLLPQAIAGLLSVLLLYVLIARTFGPPTGLLAALFLALTPIAVVDNRNNTFDSVLILILLLAAWVVTRATEASASGLRRGPLPWLLLGAVFVGLGFNVKELEAYLVLPALALLYFFGARRGWLTRVWHLALAWLAVLVVSLVWMIAVDLTPASQRPYVSDSGSNSELSLALGYNGFGRLAAGVASHLSSLPFLHVRLDFSIVPAISIEIGNPGALRLFQPDVGAQASWLLLLALAGLIVAAIQVWKRAAARPQRFSLVLWGTWFVTLVVFFSVARFYHLYCLNILGPPAAALAGIGAIALWRDYRQAVAGGRWWQGWALPLALQLTALMQAHILSGYSTWNAWLGPVLIATSLLIGCVLVAGRLHLRVLVSPDLLFRLNVRMLLAAATLGVVAALAAPAAFASVSVADGNGAGWLVQAGPSPDFSPFSGGFGLRFAGGPRGFFGRGSARSAPSFPGAGAFGGSGPPNRGGGFGVVRAGFGGGGVLTFAGSQIPTVNRGLLRYLAKHRGHSTYLVGTMTSSYASLFIIDTGQPVMTLGGYQGWDRILTPAELARLVHNGTIRFFLLSQNGRGFGGAFSSNLPAGVNANINTVNDDLSAWITSHCRAVPASTYETSISSGASVRRFGLGDQNPGTLYDCAAH